MKKQKSMDFPDSVVTYFEGMMGQPEGGFPRKTAAVSIERQTADYLPSR